LNFFELYNQYFELHNNYASDRPSNGQRQRVASSPYDILGLSVWYARSVVVLNGGYHVTALQSTVRHPADENLPVT